MEFIKNLFQEYSILITFFCFLPTILNYIILLKKNRIKQIFAINLIFWWTIIVPIALFIEVFIAHYNQNKELHLFEKTRIKEINQQE